LYHQFKQPQEAIIAYKKAAELEPNSLLAYRNIAEVYARDVGDYEQAATYYRLAITRSVSDPTLYLSYGMLLDTNLHQPEKAEKVYLEALEKTRYDRDVLLSLVELYKRMGNTTQYEEYGKILLNRYSDDSLIQQKYKAIK
jgi:Tfp pilus assembly protein PilF